MMGTSRKNFAMFAALLVAIAACSQAPSVSDIDTAVDADTAVSADLTASTDPATSVNAPTGDDQSDITADLAHFPMTIPNCGFEVHLERPPERIVAIKSTSLELLLALGLQDHVIGKAFLDGPVPQQWADAAEQIPLISKGAPAQEAILDSAPDFIFAGWESNLTAETAGERQSLADNGIASYVSPAACQSADQPSMMTFPLLFDEFADAGRYFGAGDAAATLIDEQKQLLTTVRQAKEGTTALWWSSAREIPYVGAGIGAPQMVMDEVGLTNIAGDIAQTWTPLGWESIIAADPDVIVVIDSPGNHATEKIESLIENPATAAMTAVKNERFIAVDFAAAEAGVRSAQTAVDVGNKIADFGLGR